MPDSLVFDVHITRSESDPNGIYTADIVLPPRGVKPKKGSIKESSPGVTDEHVARIKVELPLPQECGQTVHELCDMLLDEDLWAGGRTLLADLFLTTWAYCVQQVEGIGCFIHVGDPRCTLLGLPGMLTRAFMDNQWQGPLSLDEDGAKLIESLWKHSALCADLKFLAPHLILAGYRARDKHFKPL